jgi:hypothetical protein
MAQAPQDREAATDCGGAARALLRTHWLAWSNEMRAVLALGVLIALCASANAATVHHSKPRPVIVRPSQGLTAPGARFAVPGWTDDATRRWLDDASRGWSQA